MSKDISISLDEHFERFIASQVKTGRFGNRGEVVRAALRAMEEREQRAAAIRRALIEGEQSGSYGPLDMEEIIASMRQKAGLDA